jgi:hypothetical protein
MGEEIDKGSTRNEMGNKKGIHFTKSDCLVQTTKCAVGKNSILGRAIGFESGKKIDMK